MVNERFSRIASRIPSLAEVERLVAADVEILRSEQRNVLLDHAYHDLGGFRIVRVYRVMPLLLHPINALRLEVFKLAQVLVFVALKERVHMTERGEARHKIDKVLIAVIVEREHLGGGERLILGDDALKLLEHERILNVKLEHVYLVVRKHIDNREKLRQAVHPPSRYILIESAERKIGLVEDAAYGNIPVADQLTERLNAPIRARRAAALHGYPVLRDLESAALAFGIVPRANDDAVSLLRADAKRHKLARLPADLRAQDLHGARKALILRLQVYRHTLQGERAISLDRHVRRRYNTNHIFPPKITLPQKAERRLRAFPRGDDAAYRAPSTASRGKSPKSVISPPHDVRL